MTTSNGGHAQSGNPIRVLIADDQDQVRRGYAAILGTYPGIEVVGQAKDGLEAVELAQGLKPDVVLMDIRMPVMDGISATRDIAGNPLLSRTNVLVLTTFDADEYVYGALQAGASGFLLKDADPDEIADAIEVVHRGDALIQPNVLRRLVEAFATSKPNVPRKRAASQAAEADGEARQIEADITDRELEILKLVARGRTNAQIAEELFISPATVKTHVARLMSKTNSHDRAQLVVYAYETGIVAP